MGPTPPVWAESDRLYYEARLCKAAARIEELEATREQHERTISELCGLLPPWGAPEVCDFEAWLTAEMEKVDTSDCSAVLRYGRMRAAFVTLHEWKRRTKP